MGSAASQEPRSIRDRPRLGELLVRDGCITAAQLELALREQSSWGGRLGQNLADAGLIDERILATAIARQLQLQVVDLEETPPAADALRLLPVGLAERYGVVPLAVARERGRIRVACVDPTSLEATREIRRATALVPEVCVATASGIDRAIRRHYYGEDEPLPTPDPHLDVSRRSIAAPRGESDALEGVQRRLDRLLELAHGRGGR